jgi:hypothetical protein
LELDSQLPIRFGPNRTDISSAGPKFKHTKPVPLDKKHWLIYNKSDSLEWRLVFSKFTQFEQDHDKPLYLRDLGKASLDRGIHGPTPPIVHYYTVSTFKLYIAMKRFNIIG